MKNISTDEILSETATFYLSSSDFNGIEATELAKNFGVEWCELRGPICKLIKKNLVGIIYSDVHAVPHIIRTGFEKKEDQIRKLKSADSVQSCIYPSTKYLELVVDRNGYAGKPYQLLLALGEPQLSYRSFDLSVLELYRNDPRYRYECDDINGKICVSSDGLQASDQVYLKTFGFSYDRNGNRAVGAFLCYLSKLSSEHQEFWSSKELPNDYILHPDYYGSTVRGVWSQRIPICSAILKELYLVNQMATAMERPHLFHQDYGKYGESKPRKFGFLIRPTLEEFNDFVLLFDKMISENINKGFFQDDVSFEREIRRPDGKIEIKPIGTLQALDEWIRKVFIPDDGWEIWDNNIRSLKKLRRMRQKPAHAIDVNVFDQKYIKEQKDLIKRVYSAIRTLMLFLENHEAVQTSNIGIPDWLRNNLIWTK